MPYARLARAGETEEADVGDEIELISDGDGVAVIGEPSAVERFVGSLGLRPSDGPSWTSRAVAFAAGGLQVGSEVAAHSGRWVKLTGESAAKVKEYGLMDSGTPGVAHAMIGERGAIGSWLQIDKAASSIANNPAVLAGGAGIMAQMAMQQSMAEITAYLVTIDAKLDDVLRSQTNQVLSKMDGVELAIAEATSVRDSVGRVSDVTWSKVQGSSQAINETQGYALRQLADLTEKIERETKIHELVDTVRDAEADVRKWLYVLGRCVELQDAVAVLELDRVMDADPDELDRHRMGLRAARRNRLDAISSRTAELLERMSSAADRANSKVLFNPMQSPAIVRSSNQVAVDVHEFRELIGVESAAQSSSTRAWREAASEGWDAVRDTSSTGVGTVKNLGVGTVKNLGGGALDGAKSAKGLVGGKLGSIRGRRKKSEE